MRYIPDEFLTDFNHNVWSIARQVPEGKVATYGQISEMITCPQGINLNDYKAFSARWVGDAMALCAADVPWQRIINAKGEVSKRVNAQKQKTLLELEGVKFINDKINLQQYQWDNELHNEPDQGSLF